MKLKLLIISLFIFYGLILSAQEYDQKKYSKAKIWLLNKSIEELSALGVEADHGEYKQKTYLINYFSSEELTQIRQAGFNVEVLVDDASAHFIENNTYQIPPHIRQALSCLPNPSEIYNTPGRFSLGSMGGYFTYQEMLQHLDTMAAHFPNLISQRQPISADTTFNGNQIYWLRISNNPQIDQQKPRVLYNALHHAREPASLSQLIFFMYYLLENYDTDDQVKYIIDNTELYFVPCINPDGYLHNQLTNPNGGGFWRKNRRPNFDGTYGVDLNRNYGYEWGFDDFGSSPDPASEIYRGPAPFSEPETQMIRDFSIDRKFTLALNYHTFGKLLIYPWGFVPSFLTPDSIEFISMAREMTRHNRYVYGTGNQTVNYVTNGSSDDWQYGEQTLKPKVFAYTPEAGESFWDPAHTIIPVSKNNVYQNLTTALFTLNYAVAEELSGPFISSDTNYISYNITRLGMEDLGTFTVSVVPLSSEIIHVEAPKTYQNMLYLETRFDSIQIVIDTAILAETEVMMLLVLDNGHFTVTDTLRKMFGETVVAYQNNGSDISGWNTNGSWGLSSQHFYSAPTSFADSPFGFYLPETVNRVELEDPIDLTNAAGAVLNFYARWDIEARYDYAQALISTQNGNYQDWTPLCGKYTAEGGMNQDYLQPVYHSFQYEWVKEEISLDQWAGQQVKIGFLMVSDQHVEGEGFYVDDLSVTKLKKKTINVEDFYAAPKQLQLFPNPAQDHIYITLPFADATAVVTISDQLGRVMKRQQANNQSQLKLSVSDFPAGIYFCRWSTGNGAVSVAKMIINR